MLENSTRPPEAMNRIVVHKFEERGGEGCILNGCVFTLVLGVGDPGLHPPRRLNEITAHVCLAITAGSTGLTNTLADDGDDNCP